VRAAGRSGSRSPHVDGNRSRVSLDATTQSTALSRLFSFAPQSEAGAPHTLSLVARTTELGRKATRGPSMDPGLESLGRDTSLGRLVDGRPCDLRTDGRALVALATLEMPLREIRFCVAVTRLRICSRASAERFRLTTSASSSGGGAMKTR